MSSALERLHSRRGVVRKNENERDTYFPCSLWKKLSGGQVSGCGEIGVLPTSTLSLGQVAKGRPQCPQRETLPIEELNQGAREWVAAALALIERRTSPARCEEIEWGRSLVVARHLASRRIKESSESRIAPDGPFRDSRRSTY